MVHVLNYLNSWTACFQVEEVRSFLPHECCSILGDVRGYFQYHSCSGNFCKNISSITYLRLVKTTCSDSWQHNNAAFHRLKSRVSRQLFYTACMKFPKGTHSFHTQIRLQRGYYFSQTSQCLSILLGTIPFKLSFSFCIFNSFVIRFPSLSTKCNAVVTAHLKHTSSSFFMLIIAFLLVTGSFVCSLM